MTGTGPPVRSAVPYAGAYSASPYPPPPHAAPRFMPQYEAPPQPYPAAYSAGYPSPYRTAPPAQPQGMIRRAGVQVARQYAAEARTAQANALAAQRNTAAAYASLNPPPPQGLQPGAVTAVARYAKQAEAAMNAAQAARAAAKENVIKHGKHKNKKVKASAKPKASSPGDVISGAERDIVASMHTVADAARRHGMADSSWQTRIGTLMKNGQTAEASQAANQYIQNRINEAVSAKLQHASVNQASNQISQARKVIAAAAKRHAKKEMALELLAAAHLSREHHSMIEAARNLRSRDGLQEGLADDSAWREMRRQRRFRTYRRSKRSKRHGRRTIERLIDLLASP